MAKINCANKRQWTSIEINFNSGPRQSQNQQDEFSGNSRLFSSSHLLAADCILQNIEEIVE